MLITQYAPWILALVLAAGAGYSWQASNGPLAGKLLTAASFAFMLSTAVKHLPFFSEDPKRLALAAVLCSGAALFLLVLAIYPATYQEYRRASQPVLESVVTGFSDQNHCRIDYHDPLRSTHWASGFNWSTTHSRVCTSAITRSGRVAIGH
ncbi:MAG: hypothetical protein KGM91_05095 [Burkholderiales bacterium]|nr:hypothetical protein [Burkholderiales bacterium]